MRRRRQLYSLIGATALLLAVVGIVLGVVVKHEPAFYRRSYMAAGPDRQKLGQEFLVHSTAFLNLVTNGEPWLLNVVQEQLNAHLQEEGCGQTSLFTYPEGVTEPRVEFGNDQIRIGFRYGSGWWSTIVSVDLKTWLVAKESNVIALELCGLSVGGLPLGSHALMEYVSEAAREWNADVTWYRSGHHPIALIRLQANQNRPTLQLKRLEVTPGQLLIHGKPTGEPAANPEPATGEG